MKNEVETWAVGNRISQTPTLQYNVTGDIILASYTNAPLLPQQEPQQEPPSSGSGNDKAARPPSAFTLQKIGLLEKRLAHLMAQYAAVINQLNSTLGAATQVTLQAQMKQIELEIQTVEAELQKLQG